MPSLIRATNLWGYEEQVRRKGGDPLPLLARHHIPSAEKRDDAAFIVFKQLTALLEETASVLGEPSFGMRLAEYQGMDILGPISVVARSSDTVGGAINSIARYLHLHCPALTLSSSLMKHEGVPVIRLQLEIGEEGMEYRAQAYELSLANAMQVMKLLCGEAFRPLSAHFRHLPVAAESDYREIYGTQLHFEQDWSGFCLPVSIVGIPLSSADHQTWELAQRYLDSQQAPNARYLAEEVVRLVTKLLPTGQCNSKRIAAQLSMHQRTLQRRLADEGYSFETLLNDERRRLARDYLMESNLELSQITGLLGYAEQATFTRACKAWFGVTPREYRKRLIS